MLSPSKVSDFVYLTSGIVITQIQHVQLPPILTYIQIFYFGVLTYWGFLKIKNIRYANNKIKQDEQDIIENRCSAPPTACNGNRCELCPKKLRQKQ